MTRPIALIILTISLTACTSQEMYSNHVYIENRCGKPLELKAANSSNMHSLGRSMTAEAGARALVASFASYGEDVIEQIPGSYLLTIHDADGSKSLNGAQLKQHLSTVEKVSDGTQREWTIREDSICP